VGWTDKKTSDLTVDCGLVGNAYTWF